MTQKVSQCMNDSKWMDMNDGKWMNVTDVHACCELQYEKENKAQRNDKCEKCKCVVALRYMWQKKCERNVMKNRNDKCE